MENLQGPSFSTECMVSFGNKLIETMITDSSRTVDIWIRDRYREYCDDPLVVVGLDAEWKPTFTKNSHSDTAILQLCIKSKCLLIQLIYIDEIPERLKSFLADKKFIFAGADVKHDAKKLKAEYGLDVKQTLDLQQAVKSKWPGLYSKFSLADLARDIAGLHLIKSKKTCMSNWENRFLTDSQIRYASLDAFASYSVGHTILRFDKLV